MTDRERDDELEAWFAEARQAEAGWTPPFERVKSGRRRSRRGSWRWVLGAAGLAAAVLLVFVLDRRTEEAADTLPPGIGQWRSATDFLLEGSGREILTTMPRIGDSNDWFTMDISGKDSPS